MVMCITCREVSNQVPPITGGWMLKSTMQRLTKETCGHFKRTGEEPSTTEKTEKFCFERYIDVLNVV